MSLRAGQVYRRFDSYHALHSKFRAAIQAARDAVDAAARELDRGLQRQESLRSMKIAAELAKLSGLVAAPMIAGDDPRANARDVPEKLIRQRGVVQEWVNKLRQFAHAFVPQSRPTKRRPARAVKPPRERMTCEQANKIARKLAEADPNFVHRPAREWKNQIGCSLGLVAKLPMWQSVRAKKALAVPRPKAISLTKGVENRAIAEQAELDVLIAESEADRASEERRCGPRVRKAL